MGMNRRKRNIDKTKMNEKKTKKKQKKHSGKKLRPTPWESPTLGVSSPKPVSQFEVEENSE